MNRDLNSSMVHVEGCALLSQRQEWVSSGQKYVLEAWTVLLWGCIGGDR